MWRCGDVEMWRCGDVEMWRCGDVEMWRCGDVKKGVQFSLIIFSVIGPFVVIALIK